MDTKARMFVASSIEHLDLAYAVQENLDRDVEVTVWSQGVFAPSRPTMISLLEMINNCEFGLFILSPDDVTSIRNMSKQTVRDNVIFELGMFIGRIGVECCFMLVPRDVEGLHLPTDLLGLTPITFDPFRTDKNLVAALGPACNVVRKAITSLHTLSNSKVDFSPRVQNCLESTYSDPQDCIALIESWMGSRPCIENTRAMRYAEIDYALKLSPGSALLYVEKAASKWGYVTARKGKDIILFEDTN